ncbi:MAG: alpha-N-acetylglucosaminidase [Flavisolibacter sp.]
MRYLVICFLVVFYCSCYGQVNISVAKGLVSRVVHNRASEFIVESILAENGKDAFEIEERNNKIILRGNNGVAIGSALYYYLTNFCHCQITWNGINLKLPLHLPHVTKKIHISTPYQYRYYLNYCTFNYSMSWWNWRRWQKEIDWMALHGINMSLAITGEEYCWYIVYKELGFTDKELRSFFSGPCYFAWFWMGNLDGWGGPLPISWMKSHKLLQQQIVNRERELGMKPVLPAFTGHVPSSFAKHFPNAKLKTTNWKNGFADTYILDSEDPLFKQIAKRFIEKQTALFGTDHLYSADTFNENEPPSDDTSYLSALSKRLYEGMKLADKKALWLMQGWLFYSDRKFWKPKQVKALLDAVPDSAMMLLDLAAEIEPVWKRTDAFYGKPWIWNMLHNFGGNISLFGRMDGVATGPAEALQSPDAGKLSGIGLTMEGIEQNPVLYELMTSHTWRNEPININEWLAGYVKNRYGSNDTTLVNAWQGMRKTVYNGQLIRDGAESIITGRPTFDSSTTWTRTRLNYDPAELLPVWEAFIKVSDRYKSSDGFQYDIVDITRQVLANYADTIHHRIVVSYRRNEADSFKFFANQFLDLIDDLDELLGTRKDYLTGLWINNARAWGTNETEKQIYERNAKDIITLWGDENSPLHEYSCRQWNGLLKEFYKYRWQQFFNRVEASLKDHQSMDVHAFHSYISKWEWKWVNTHSTFKTITTGDPVKEAKRIYTKYQMLLRNTYKSNKPL